MIDSKDHLVISSFKEFLNFRLLKDIQAYSTKTVSLYEYTPPRVAGKIAYGSAYHHWVYDSSLVTIPTTVGGLARGGSEGMTFDFRNGRILVNSGNTGLTLSTTVPIQDFGLFVTSKPDALLLNEVQFEQPPVLTTRDTYLAPDNIYCPAVFVKIAQTRNRPFALSGLDWSSWQIRVVCLAQNYSQAVGVGSVVRDMKERIFPVLTAAQTPLKVNGDLKVPPWTYSSYLTNPSEYCFIMDTSYDIVEDDVFTHTNPKLFVGIGEIQCYLARQSRIGL